MKSAVIYARYSSDSQTEQSIEGQIRVCKQYAAANDMLIVDTYIDRAMTGTNDNRAAFQKMLKDSEKKQWQIILVYKLDRFSRNKYESVVHKKTLKDNGVRLISAMENIPDSPEGTLMESLLEGFNQYYSEELTQKVIRGLKESWIKGNATGGNHIYGYDIIDKKYVINEKEAEIINEVYNRCANGETMTKIADELNKKGIYRHDGKKFRQDYISFILHNKRYTGEVTHQGVVYYNIFPRIISDSQWMNACKMNEQNKVNPSRKKDIYNFILTSKMYCGICHKKMIGISGTSCTGKSYSYYSCNNKHNKKICETKPLKKEYIEDLVVNKTVSFLQNRNTIHTIAEKMLALYKKQNEENTAIKHLLKQRESLKKSTSNIISAIEQGIITDSTKQRLIDLESQIKQLDFDISQEQLRLMASLTIEDIEKFLNEKFCENTDDIEIRKCLINTFVKHVIVYPNKIIINYNFTDSPPPGKKDTDSTDEITYEPDSSFNQSPFPPEQDLTNYLKVRLFYFSFL